MSQRLRRSLGLGLLLVALLLGTLAWLLHTAAGAAWLLARVPGLQVEAPEGALLGGGFSARRLRYAWAGGTLDIHGLRLTGLHLAPAERALHVQRLAADSVELHTVASTAPTPVPVPDSLALPLGLQVEALNIAALRIDRLAPLTGLAARVELPRHGPHRLRLNALRWQQLQASGEISVAADAPLATQGRLQIKLPIAYTTADTTADASVTLTGPLARLTAEARLQAAGQRLDATAELRPFAAWPLSALDARFDALNLAALLPAAPRTALTGQARLQAPAPDAPATLQLDLRNSAAGRWDQGALPLQRLVLALQGRPDQLDSLVLSALQAELPGGAGLSGQGRRGADGGWQLSTRVHALRPEALDARAPTARLDGPVTLAGGAGLPLRLKADLTGSLQTQPLRVSATAQGQGSRWRLDELLLASGTAEVSARGQIDLTGSARLQARLSRFDPRPWWRGTPGSAWARLGATQLDADLDVAVVSPAGLARPAQATGRLSAEIRPSSPSSPSRLGGLALEGRASLQRTAASEPARADADLRLGGNRLQLQGEARADAGTAQLRWQAPALAELQPLLALLGLPPLSGRADGEAELQLARTAQGWQAGSSGQLTLDALSLGPLALQQLRARWSLPAAAPDGDGPLALDLTLQGLKHPQLRVARGRVELQGRRAAHTLQASLDGRLTGPDLPLVAQAQASGGWRDGGWAGRMASLNIAPLRAGAPPLLAASDLGLSLGLGLGLEPRVALAPGRAEVAGAGVRWSALSWQGGNTPAARAELQLESLAVAPLLARWQPDFGWGGDLVVTGHASLSLDQRLSTELLIERQRGDLSVTDEFGARPLGLSDLRLALGVREEAGGASVWQIAHGLAGTQLGGVAGAVTLRPAGLWPDRDTPLQGVLQAHVTQLANWGAWVPAGWRLGGRLAAAVRLDGRVGAPQLHGQADGEGLALRHLLYGVDFSEGRFALALEGQNARLTALQARGGDGWLRGSGTAQFGSTPTAQLDLEADRLRLLARVDRRVVASGNSRLRLQGQDLALDGQLRIDEGVYDFSRADAPALADDVQVARGPRAAAPAVAAPGRQVAVKLGLDFGRNFKVLGRGLATVLRGQLQLTQQGGPPRLTGKLAADGGQYAAYGQKLEIERGDISFSGALDNPALDLLAIRPNLDTRVGVQVSGTAQSPRVGLFSEPDMADTDKLSWLLLGRGPDGLGRTDTALLQRAAVALLAGEGEGLTGRAIKGLGLDELSLSQTDDDTRATIVRLGKQLSRRWYVGYERSLNATTGSWQLVYRIAQRFTLRAQSGDDNALDLIWQWRWD